VKPVAKTTTPSVHPVVSRLSHEDLILLPVVPRVKVVLHVKTGMNQLVLLPFLPAMMMDIHVS
jgi:hypothetical protein